MSTVRFERMTLHLHVQCDFNDIVCTNLSTHNLCQPVIKTLSFEFQMTDDHLALKKSTKIALTSQGLSPSRSIPL